MTDVLSHLDISTEARERAAEKDEALPDGSYPIRNKGDLQRAIQSYGRAADKEKVKAWIIKRARELDAADMLPESWDVEDISHSDELAHYGILGMKWGVRRDKFPAGAVGNQPTNYPNMTPHSSSVDEVFGVPGAEPPSRKQIKTIRKETISAFHKVTDKETGVFRENGPVSEYNRSHVNEIKNFGDRQKYYDGLAKVLTADAQKMMPANRHVALVNDSVYKSYEFLISNDKTALDKAVSNAEKGIKSNLDYLRKNDEEYPESDFVKNEFPHILEHSDVIDENFIDSVTLEPIYDNDGILIDFKLNDKDAVEHAQSIGQTFLGQLFNESDTLAHHGVKGQKWGVRKPEIKLTPSNSEASKITQTKSKDAETKTTKSSGGGGGGGGGGASDTEDDDEKDDTQKDDGIPEGDTKKEFDERQKMIDEFLKSKGKGDGAKKAGGGKGGGGGKGKGKGGGGKKGVKKGGAKKSSGSSGSSASSSASSSVTSTSSPKTSYPARQSIANVLKNVSTGPKITTTPAVQAIIDKITASVEARRKTAVTTPEDTAQHADESTRKELAMTQEETVAIGADSLDDFLVQKSNELSHYGVLGMKWGVRRDRTGHIKARATLSRSGRKEMSIMADPKSTGYRKAYNAIYKKAAGKIRQGTRQLNNDPRFKGQDFRKPSKLRSQYYGEYSKMVTQQLNAATALKGVKGAKTLTMDWTFNVEKENLPKATIKIKDTRQGRKEIRDSAKEIRRSVRHADEEMFDDLEGSIDIDFDLDEMGYIMGFRIADDDEMEHAITLGRDFIDGLMGDSEHELAHYGVLGMKWGVRNDDRGSGRPQGGASRKKAPLSSVKKMVSSKKTNTGAPKTETQETNKSSNARVSEAKVETQQESAQKSGRSMSDQELRDAINRMQMEKTYAQLLAEHNPGPAKKADSAIKTILRDSTKQAFGQLLTNTLKVIGTYAIAAAISKSNPALANAMMKGVGDNAKKAAETKTDQPDATVSTPKTSNQNSSNQPKSNLGIPEADAWVDKTATKITNDFMATMPKAKGSSSSLDLGPTPQLKVDTKAVEDAYSRAYGESSSSTKQILDDLSKIRGK